MTNKATHKLSKFNFEVDGAHVALVGSAANNRTVLLTKSTDKVTEEDVTKASTVTVTISITEYLRKFFGLWYEDAELLARIFGYTTEEMEEEGEYVDWYNDYMNEKVAAVSIMKSLVIDKSEDEINKAVAELSPKDYLEIIKSQEIFEKNFNAVVKDTVKKSSIEGVTTPQGVTSPLVDINKQNKEDTMSDFISKSAHESALTVAIEKAVAPIQAELTKATEIIKQYEQEKTEAVAKSRKEAIAKVESDATAAEELFKSLETVDVTAFDAVIKALQKSKEKAEASGLLDEVGGTGNSEAVTKAVDSQTNIGSRTAEILKQQFAQGK